MNKDAFLKCLEYTGVDTGTSVIGVYSFSSGLSDACFNQLYSTGSNYFNGLPYDNALPLIYIGEGDQPSGFFSSKSPYCINKTSGNFGILISMNYSGCLNMGNLNQILFSSVSGLNNSGMFIGITPSNRLFLNINNYFSTISKEITPSDFTFFSLENNRFINFGIFNIKDNTFYQKSYDHGASDIKVEKLYFGGGLKYNQNQTGYSGKLNEIYLFSGNLTNNLLNGCINCSYATGYKFNQISIPFTGIKITGSLWSGVNEIQITGYQKIISSQKRIDDSLRNFYYDSGVTGIVQIYESLIPKTELISNEFITSGIEFNFDNQKIYSQTKFDLFFDLGLQSGDVIEVYTCNQFNPNVNLDIINNTFPTSNNYVQLFGNGLAETISGESQFFVDYSTVFDNKILGFDEFDILTYDLTTGNSITASYNNDDCVTGQSTSSQMIDLLNVKGIFAEVNSLENISPFIYDLYLNGKKLISGFDYVITGIYNVGLNTWSNHIYLSGDNALLYNLPDPQEFKLVISQKNYIRNLFQINKDTYNLTGLSGFSEQIWRNGIRQKNGIDYLIKNNCSFYTGNYFDSNYSFEILNSTNLFINNFITFDEPFLNEIF